MRSAQLSQDITIKAYRLICQNNYSTLEMSHQLLIIIILLSTKHLLKEKNKFTFQQNLEMENQEV